MVASFLTNTYVYLFQWIKMGAMSLASCMFLILAVFMVHVSTSTRHLSTWHWIKSCHYDIYDTWGLGCVSVNPIKCVQFKWMQNLKVFCYYTFRCEKWQIAFSIWCNESCSNRDRWEIFQSFASHIFTKSGITSYYCPCMTVTICLEATLWCHILGMTKLYD